MNTYTEITPTTMASPTPVRRFSLTQLLTAVFVSALAAFAVTYQVTRSPVTFPSHLAQPAMQMAQYAPVAAQYAPVAEQYAPVAEQYAPVAEQYAPVAEQYAPVAAPYSVGRGFVPTNVCAYGRGACADTVNAPAGTPYTAYRQCTDGKAASRCKCFGVRGKGGAASPVSVVDETLLSNGLCRCVFVSAEGPETSHWGMIIGCQ